MQFARRVSFLVFVLFLGAGLVVENVGYGQFRIDNIASKGDTAPDGNGTFSDPGIPVINDNGHAAFHASLGGTTGGHTDNFGFFRASSGVVTQVARKGQTAPDGNGLFGGSNQLLNINSLGEVVIFWSLSGTTGGVNDDTGIFLGSQGSVTSIAREGYAIPNSTDVYSAFNAGPFLQTAFNSAGNVAFFALTAASPGGPVNGLGVFTGDGSTTTTVALAGDPTPDNNGTYSFFGKVFLNESNQMAFQAQLVGTSGGTSDDRALFMATGGTVQLVAREGQPAPGSNGLYGGFLGATLDFNNSGQIASLASLTATSGGSSDNAGIFLFSGGVHSDVVRKGDAAPDANGFYLNLGGPKINESSQVAFLSGLSGTSGGTLDDEGLFRFDGSDITQIVRKGQAAPDGNGTISDFSGIIEMNDSGQLLFDANLTGTSGGSTDNEGIFTSDGIDFFQVVRKGQSLAGSTILGIVKATEYALNEHGQIGYRANLANADVVLQVWTPELNWRGTSSGNWDDSGSWTLSLNPAFVHDVFINPATDLTVTGPTTDRTVRSLQVGGGSGMATFDMNGSSLLTALNDVIIGPNGILTGQALIDGDLTIDGKFLAGISGTAPSLFDRIEVSGDLGLTGDLFVQLENGFSLQSNQLFLIADVAGVRNGMFNGLSEGALVGVFGGTNLYITYSAGNGNDIALFTSVPEPATAAFLGMALASLIITRRRRASNTANIPRSLT